MYRIKFTNVELVNLLNTLKHDKLQYLEDFQKWFKLINNDLLYYLYHDEYILYVMKINLFVLHVFKN